MPIAEERVSCVVVWVYTWYGLCSDPNLSISSHRTAGIRGALLQRLRLHEDQALMGVAEEFLCLVTRDLLLARWLRTCVQYQPTKRIASVFYCSLVNHLCLTPPTLSPSTWRSSAPGLFTSSTSLILSLWIFIVDYSVVFRKIGFPSFRCVVVAVQLCH